VTIPTDRSQVSPSGGEIRTRSRQQPAAGRKRNMMCRAQEPRPPTVVEGRVTGPSDPKVGLFIISSPARNAKDRILTETQDRSEIVGQHEVHRSAEPISQSHPGSIPPWLPRTRHLRGAASRPSAPTSSPRSAGRCSVHRSGWWSASRRFDRSWISCAAAGRD
jgi:hypothetical protein